MAARRLPRMVKLKESRCGFLRHRLNAALSMWPGLHGRPGGAGGLTIPERPRDRAVRGNAPTSKRSWAMKRLKGGESVVSWLYRADVIGRVGRRPRRHMVHH